MKSPNDIKKILVPVALTDEFYIALDQAMHFHKAYRTEILLLHVAHEYSFLQRVLKRERIHSLNIQVKDRLEGFIKKYFNGKKPQNIDYKIVNGPLVQSILKEASSNNCDLIIIKKAAKTKNPGGFFRTENADKIISEAVCPVLTISNDPTSDEINDILLPVDIFKKSANKVAWAISIAKQFNSTLHIICVLSIDIKPEDSLAYRKSKDIEEAIRKEGIKSDTVILKSGSKSIAQTVLEYSDKIKPDMIMIMTHQETILRDNYLGSFAGDIIHTSELPVFSVVPRKETLLDGFLDPITRQILTD
jgi:nucleotide-binding universal stress UspA family protein